MMNTAIFIILEVLVYLQSVSSTINIESVIEPTVQTDWATIKGIRQNVLGHEIDAFLGIPFAKPPINGLRFRRPVKPEKYQNEVYSAQSFGPPCAQLPNDENNLTFVSEDCLYLNIWRPSSNNSIQNLKPVYFYVFGSGLEHGSVTERKNHGNILASIGDLIVVTFNHRLAFLVYGYGGSDAMPGNMGVYDILMALQWVHDNIESFHGDPNQLTFAGDSSGSMQANTLALSPAIPSKLFNKLHLMSGVSTRNTVESKDYALKKTKLLAESVGCAESNSSIVNDTEPISSETINCLRGLNWTVILEAMYIPEITSTLKSEHYPPFQQIWGTDLLPFPPDFLVERGKPSTKLHILLGIEEDEDQISEDFVPIDKMEVYEYLRNYTRKERVEKMTDEDFDRIFKYYFKAIKEDDKFNLKVAITSFIGDYSYHCPSLLYGEKWTQHGQLVHGYINEYVMEGYSRQERPFGTFHGDDAFQILGIAFRENDKFNDRDRQVTREMISFVADFVKGIRLHWPPMLTRKDGHVLPLRWIINEKMDPRLIQIDPKDDICNYWGKVSGFKLSF